VEMTFLWKPQNGSHRNLEISPSTRDSHISTARTSFLMKKKKTEKRPDHLSTTNNDRGHFYFAKNGDISISR
jgi:hypothetical protein